MRPLIFAGLCAATAFSAVSALQVVVRPLVHCDGVLQRWDTSNASILNTAFLWTKGMPIKNWEYTQSEVNALQTLDDECVHVEYDTLVPVPFFFVAYTGDSRQKVHIAKTVCTGRAHKKLREVAIVRNIPFIDTMTLRIQGDLRDSDTKLTAEWKLSLPWYLELLRQQIEQHVRKSLQEYLQLLASTTCAGSPKRSVNRRQRTTAHTRVTKRGELWRL